MVIVTPALIRDNDDQSVLVVDRGGIDQGEDALDEGGTRRDGVSGMLTMGLCGTDVGHRRQLTGGEER